MENNLTLEQRLASYDPIRHGGEAMQTNRRRDLVVPRHPGLKKDKAWIPDRREIIWIDCKPQAGKETRDVHPFLVLSPKIFNDRTSLVIVLPMTTA